MEDLQSTLQSILSDPEQMRRITAMAESLGLGPPLIAAQRVNLPAATNPSPLTGADSIWGRSWEASRP